VDRQDEQQDYINGYQAEIVAFLDTLKDDPVVSSSILSAEVSNKQF
jgi:hypothetical protein